MATPHRRPDFAVIRCGSAARVVVNLAIAAGSTSGQRASPSNRSNDRSSSGIEEVVSLSIRTKILVQIFR
jgi:hypothetical protein